MKKIFLIGFIILAKFSLCQTNSGRKILNADSLIKVQNENRKAWIGKAYPDFLIVSNNTEYSNQKLKGKVIFVNFWFSACAPCLAEMEDLNRLFEKFNSNSKFEFLSFTFDSPEQIEVIKKKYNILYKIFSISNEECYRLNLRGGFPTNIVIDSNGLVKYISLIGKADNFMETIYSIILNSL